MEFFDVLNSQRAFRKFLPIPVEEDKLKIILEAATKAPSGNNVQPWEFIVIRDPQVKSQLKDVLSQAYDRMDARRVMPEKEMVDTSGRTVTGRALVEATDSIPVMIAVCFNVTRASIRKRLRPDPLRHKLTDDQGRENHPSMYASIFPAVQNLLLAARALGIGSCLTMLVVQCEDEVKKILGIPNSERIMTLLYLGYPVEKLGPSKRLPLERVVHYDHW